jgi:hypothetical protein
VLPAAAVTIVPRRVLGGARQIPPSEKVNIAGIGVGGMGAANLSNLASENIVALCDVDFNFAAGTLKKYPQAKPYKDYRKMLEQKSEYLEKTVCKRYSTEKVGDAPRFLAANICGEFQLLKKP